MIAFAVIFDLGTFISVSYFYGCKLVLFRRKEDIKVVGSYVLWFQALPSDLYYSFLLNFANLF